MTLYLRFLKLIEKFEYHSAIKTLKNQILLNLNYSIGITYKSSCLNETYKKKNINLY